MSTYSGFSIAGFRLTNVPPAISGLALGLSSLGLLWQHLYGIGQASSAVVAIFMLLLVTIKYAITPSQLMTDLKHLVLGSTLPIYTMALMVVSSFIHHYSVNIAFFIWFVAILLHFISSVVFAYFQIP